MPQQAWDQVLYELGRRSAQRSSSRCSSALARDVVARRRGARSPRRTVVPAAWIGANVGALAGDALFGGTPLGALFWLVSGLAVATAFDEQDT